MSNSTNYSSSPQEKQLCRPTTRKNAIEKCHATLSDGRYVDAVLYERTAEKDVRFKKFFDEAGDDQLDKNVYSCAIWLRIMRYMEYNNSIIMSIQDICTAFGCSTATAVKAMKVLKDEKYIKPQKNIRGLYVVNPWKATKISAVYRPALEEAWQNGTTKFVQQRINEISDELKRKRRQKQAEIAELLVEEPTEMPGSGAIEHEQLRIEDRIRSEAKKIGNRKRQQAYRDRQREKKALQTAV